MSVRIMSLKLNRLLLYALMAVAALILLILLLVRLVGGGSDTEAKFYPGTYTTSVALGTGSVTVEMFFSEDGIETVNYEIPEVVQTMYPLVQPTASSIGSQLTEGIDPDAVQVDSCSSETAAHLLAAMKLTMEKAKVE